MTKSLNKTILIIEEDHDSQVSWTNHLHEYGFTAIPAKSATEALKAYFSHKIDLIISNMHLKDVDALELLTWSVKESLRKIPVILATNSNEIDNSYIYSLGGVKLIHKPIDFKKIVKEIQYILMPKDEIWSYKKREPQEVKSLVLDLPSYLKAKEMNIFQIGQGGFCLTDENCNLSKDTYTKFHISFSKDFILDGAGLIKYRKIDKETNTPRLGIEIDYLTSPSIEMYQKLLEEEKPLLYIPCTCSNKRNKEGKTTANF